MATSTKVQFSLKKLREKALESIDFRIAQKQRELDELGSDEIFAERVKEWRENQEKKLSEVFRQLGDGELDDYRLSKFKLDPIPEQDRYERSRTERELRKLESTRSQIVAKSESLVGDEDGNISLTKTQLDEFFGL